ncbi:hypothetical protein [Pseudomonas sp. efr-133-TYG-5]|uniref:hypothetical protein n=1 Tax=Pseudomonas sp. efr-133-TYG-5 TaxID=3040310 RepID=UPI002557A276|nr:hypothetical protein [Pseudomonas sp. efr-133-TYG-5]
MTEPGIRADRNLVINGEFELAFDGWVKGPDNRDYLTTGSAEYEGVGISFLSAGNRSSVSQDLVVPKRAGATANYELTFLCEVLHTLPGTLQLSVVGKPGEVQDIPLRPARTAAAAAGVLAFVPIAYTERVTLALQENDSLRVSVLSPANASGDYVSAVRITRINLALHLPPTRLQGLQLDAQALPLDQVLPLCLGASAELAHRLAFVPAADDPWQGTLGSLSIEGNPQGAIVATPGWGVDQPLGEPWTLDCPLLEGDEPQRLNLILRNEFSAEAYPLAVSLGHHRVAFLEVEEAAYYPVLELGQTVQLGVRLGSYYSGQHLEGLTVNWTVEGQGIRAAAVTRADGWAYYTFEPETAGTVDIVASVVSPYYAAGVVTQHFAVQVLATDPWQALTAIVGNVAKPWAQSIGYPNRGSAYALQIGLPEVLVGTTLALGWSGDSAEQLGVVTAPPINEPVPMTDRSFVWTLQSADVLDGHFELSLHCSKLLLPSPKKTMSLARNEVRIGEVREANIDPVVEDNESALLRVQVLHRSDRGDGDPVSRALVDWVTAEGTVATLTGGGGWASVHYTPKTPGSLTVIARVRAHADAVPVEREFALEAIASSPWKREVRLYLDGVEVDTTTVGLLCKRGFTQTLKVVPVAGSPWLGKTITLNWRGADPAIGLVPSDLGAAKPLLASGVEWTLGSDAVASTSSLFALLLQVDGVAQTRQLFGRLFSPALEHELNVLLDQIAAALDGTPLYPCLGAQHRYSVLPNLLSPLVGLTVALRWTGAMPDELGARIEPAHDVTQPLSDGGATWLMDFRDSPQPAAFALTLALPQLQIGAAATPMSLDHNKIRLHMLREAAIDPVVGLDKAWLWAQVVSHFTDQPIAGATVTWEAQERTDDVPTDAQGWSAFGYAPTLAGTQSVTATVVSRFDNFRQSRSSEVKAHATDPWAGLRISFDGVPPQPLGERTCFPRRNGRHLVELTAANDSPLLGTSLALGMTGSGPADLAMEFVPNNALGAWRPFAGSLHYQLNVGDLRDGSCTLRVGAERLARLSPPVALSVGPGAQVLQIRVDSAVNQTLDWGQSLRGQVSVISSISGRPMPGWTVTWTSPDIGSRTSVTDFYGVASMEFVPTTPGAAHLQASVGQGLNLETVALPYALNEPRRIESLSSPNPSGELGARVSATITLVSARTGQPLNGIEVRWKFPDLNIAPTYTDEVGESVVEFRMPAVNRALLEATVTGGLAGWVYQHIEFRMVPNV